MNKAKLKICIACEYVMTTIMQELLVFLSISLIVQNSKLKEDFNQYLNEQSNVSPC